MSDADPLNLHHLRYFYEIARTGSMKRAAERLGVSQPALSKQTSALEESLGFPLFHRSPEGHGDDPGRGTHLRAQRAHVRPPA
jgi:molybdenum-dependent DNA-binding transcriptional regulator ModE